MDIEKIVRILAAGGTVTTIHLHEGTNIHDNQIDTLYTGEIGSHAKQEKIESGQSKSEEYKNDPLFFVFGRDIAVYEEAVDVAHNCETPKDISTHLGPIVRKKIGKEANTVKTAILIIPHLINYKCVKKPRYIANAM